MRISKSVMFDIRLIGPNVAENIYLYCISYQPLCLLIFSQFKDIDYFISLSLFRWTVTEQNEI